MKGSTIIIVLGVIFLVGVSICKTAEALKYLSIFFAVIASLLIITGIRQWMMNRRDLEDDDLDIQGEAI